MEIISSLFIACITIILGYYITGIDNNSIQRIIMLVKWFIIGKYHCDLPKWALRAFTVVNRLFWGIIAFSLCYTCIIMGGLDGTN